jgi:hypothetical protein
MHGIENDCCIHYGVWWGGGWTNGGGERHVVNKAGVGPVTAWDAESEPISSLPNSPGQMFWTCIHWHHPKPIQITHSILARGAGLRDGPSCRFTLLSTSSYSCGYLLLRLVNHTSSCLVKGLRRFMRWVRVFTALNGVLKFIRTTWSPRLKVSFCYATYKIRRRCTAVPFTVTGTTFWRKLFLRCASGRHNVERGEALPQDGAK